MRQETALLSDLHALHSGMLTLHLGWLTRLQDYVE